MRQPLVIIWGVVQNKYIEEWGANQTWQPKTRPERHIKVHRRQELVHPLRWRQLLWSTLTTDQARRGSAICRRISGELKTETKTQVAHNTSTGVTGAKLRGTEEHLVEWIVSHQLSRCDRKLWLWDYWRCCPWTGGGAAHTVQREWAQGKGRRRFAKRLSLNRNEIHILSHIFSRMIS